ncbi:MAG: ATP-binding cassette domain-containing protein, partial [Bacteroidota bacterium]|nr:ATP-binding cassette domain-containing protein [Bacteroidota bacterium]
MDDASIIKIDNLTKRFHVGTGEFTALHAINLSFGKGEFAGLVGPSGSGKTTLLNIIGSLDNPTEGNVWVCGRSVSSLSIKQSAAL